MLKHSVEQWVGVLQGWNTIRAAGWPSLCAAMGSRTSAWPTMTASQLEAEARRYLDEMNAADCTARLFWKRLPDYTYAGSNRANARDAGFARPEDILGRDDFSTGVSWHQQAAKYRADDERVVASGKPLFDILERLTQAHGNVVYIRTNKAPLRTAGGAAFGVIGMFEVLDEATARRLHHAKMRDAGY